VKLTKYFGIINPAPRGQVGGKSGRSLWHCAIKVSGIATDCTKGFHHLDFPLQIAKMEQNYGKLLGFQRFFPASAFPATVKQKLPDCEV